MDIYSKIKEKYDYEVPAGYYFDNIQGGKGAGLRIEDVDPNELLMGIEVEFEHTSDVGISIEIALDHLAEIKDYYTRLIKMENTAEKQINTEVKKMNNKMTIMESNKEDFIRAACDNFVRYLIGNPNSAISALKSIVQENPFKVTLLDSDEYGEIYGKVYDGILKTLKTNLSSVPLKTEEENTLEIEKESKTIKEEETKKTYTVTKDQNKWIVTDPKDSSFKKEFTSEDDLNKFLNEKTIDTTITSTDQKPEDNSNKDQTPATEQLDLFKKVDQNTLHKEISDIVESLDFDVLFSEDLFVNDALNEFLTAERINKLFESSKFEDISKEDFNDLFEYIKEAFKHIYKQKIFGLKLENKTNLYKTIPNK